MFQIVLEEVNVLVEHLNPAGFGFRPLEIKCVLGYHEKVDRVELALLQILAERTRNLVSERYEGV